MHSTSNNNQSVCPRRERSTIVLVASGTSDPSAAEVFSHIDAVAKGRYDKHQVRWAFTAKAALLKLKHQGVDVTGLDEIVAELTREGCRRVVLQSLHVTPGGDYDKLAAVDAPSMQTAVGAALLADDESIAAVVEALSDSVRRDAFNVVVCHGSRKHPLCTRQLAAFAEKAEAAYENLAVCSLIGLPGTDKLAVAKREAAKLSRVHFIPLMVTAGVHVANDVLGDEPDSWKSMIDAGETTSAEPLGCNEKMLDVWFAHLDAALAEL